MKPYMMIFTYYNDDYGYCQGVRFYDDYESMKEDEFSLISIELEKVECYMRNDSLPDVGYVRM